MTQSDDIDIGEGIGDIIDWGKNISKKIKGEPKPKESTMLERTTQHDKVMTEDKFTPSKNIDTAELCILTEMNNMLECGYKKGTINKAIERIFIANLEKQPDLFRSPGKTNLFETKDIPKEMGQRRELIEKWIEEHYEG